MIYIDIKDKSNRYSLFNGLPVKVMNWHRDDGLIDIEIPSLEMFILVKHNQLRGDEDE